MASQVYFARIVDKTVVFMGTSDFSVPVLLALVKNGYAIKMVYTRNDSTGGRGQKMLISPVKRAALDNSLPVRQPRSLRDLEELDFLKSLNPDIIIVAAYGLILPREVLSLPPLGCVNVHPSLLPKYRGPSPIPFAILSGDKVSGVSMMLMDEGVDTGPVLRQEEIAIGNDDTTESLTRKLAERAGSLLLRVLPDWFEGRISPVPQDHQQTEATYSKIIKKEDGEIDWQRSTARQILLRVRAFHPWPGCYTRWRGKLLKILGAEALDCLEAPGKVAEISLKEGAPSKVIGVGTKEGVLALAFVQYEGGRPMTGVEFVRGHRGFVGSNLRNKD